MAIIAETCRFAHFLYRLGLIFLCFCSSIFVEEGDAIGLNAKSGIGQLFTETFAQGVFVFDDQQSHGSSPGSSVSAGGNPDATLMARRVFGEF